MLSFKGFSESATQFFFFFPVPLLSAQNVIWWSFYREDHVRFERWFQAYSSPVPFDGPFLLETWYVFTIQSAQG